MRDDVPLLGVLRTSAVIGAPSIPGGYPRQLDGPTEAHFPTTPREECRLSGSQDAFHRHGHEGMIAKGWLPPAFVPALSLTPPTLCSQFGDSVLIGLCKVTGAVTRGPVMLESADAFVARWYFRAWD
jgi:hypothetical protein